MEAITMGRFDSPEFKKLQAEYYKKIADQFGFKDIENNRGDLIDHQSVYDFSQRINFKTEYFEMTVSYYAWASEMVHRGNFKCEKDELIWILHSEGKTSRKIAKTIGAAYSGVVVKIKKIRAYLKEQTNHAMLKID